MLSYWLRGRLTSSSSFLQGIVGASSTLLLLPSSVDIIRVPELREKLTISTSIYECKPLFGFRNDIIRDEQGEPCYVSYSMGAFIDLQTAKLSPLPQEMIDSLTLDEKYPMEYCDRLPREI